MYVYSLRVCFVCEIYKSTLRDFSLPQCEPTQEVGIVLHPCVFHVDFIQIADSTLSRWLLICRVTARNRNLVRAFLKDRGQYSSKNAFFVFP